MQNSPDPLTALASPPPTLSATRVREVIAGEYGLHGTLEPLVSERDQNFCLITGSGERYVVKIANVAEPAEVTDFQVQALLHIERAGCSVGVPRVVLTRSGGSTTAIPGADSRHTLRVVSYLPGRPLGATAPRPALARQLGECLAKIDLALQGFSNRGETQPLLWDMQQADRLAELLPHIRDTELSDRVAQCLDDFRDRVLPQFPSLRSQVIHNDLNPNNVLLSEDDPESITGVIDFGDMLRAPLIVDVAIAASYLRCDDQDALAPLVAFVAGYNEVLQLEHDEISLLQDLVRTRLATTITILHWRLSARGEDDAYAAKSLQSEASAVRFLQRIDAVPREEFAARLLPKNVSA